MCVKGKRADVVFSKDVSDNKPFFILPGDCLYVTFLLDPPDRDKPAVQIDLRVDFREPFSADEVVVTSVRVDLRIAAKDEEKANV